MKMNMPPHRLDAVVFMYIRAFCSIKSVNLLTIQEKEVIIREYNYLEEKLYVCKMDLGRRSS